MKLILLTTVIFVLAAQKLSAQMIDAPEWSQFRWKNRLLVVVADDPNFIEEQLSVLNNTSKKGWKERKLKWILLTSASYRIQDQDWSHNSKLYKKFADKDATNCTVLIGLDGSVKLKQTSKLTAQELFDLIDTMPMRMSEMKQ